MPTTTFLENREPIVGDGRLTCAGGSCFLGDHTEITAAELAELKGEGISTAEGPSVSPGAPSARMVVVAGSAGTPSGAYKYVVTFKTTVGETLASPEIAITLTSQKGNLSAIPVAPAGSGVIARKIYRTVAGGASGTEKLVTEIADNTTTTFEDNVADGSLGATLPAVDTSSNVVAAEAGKRKFGWHQGT